MARSGGWRGWLREKAIDWGLVGIIGLSLLVTLIGISVALSPASLVAGAIVMTLGAATAVSAAVFVAYRHQQQTIKRAEDQAAIREFMSGSDSTSDMNHFLGVESQSSMVLQQPPEGVLHRLTLFFHSLSRSSGPKELLQESDAASEPKKGMANK